jgi:hypothetical protein
MNLPKWLKTFTLDVVVIPLIRLEYKLDLFILKRAGKVQLLISQKLRDRIRYLIPEACLEGYDKEFDKRVHLAALKIVRPETFDDHPPASLFTNMPDAEVKGYAKCKSEYLEDKAQIDNLVKKVEKEDNTKTLIVNYALVQHFLAGRLKREDEANYWLLKARSSRTEVLPLKTKDLFVLERNLRKDINWLRNEIGDRQALKISLSLEKTGSLISIISGFFIITGYLYDHFLFGEFGIEVSNFFTLSDYLASSIEGLRFSAMGAGIALITYFLGVHRFTRKSYAQIKFEQRRRYYADYLFFLAMLAFAIRAYVQNLEIFYDVSLMLIILISMFFVPRIAIKYFKEPLIAIFVLVFISSYSAYMFSSIERTIYRLKYYPMVELEQYDFKFKENIPKDESDLMLFGANSNYLFFLDKDRKAFIISRESVLYFSSLTSEK